MEVRVDKHPHQKGMIRVGFSTSEDSAMVTNTFTINKDHANNLMNQLKKVLEVEERKPEPFRCMSCGFTIDPPINSGLCNSCCKR